MYPKTLYLHGDRSNTRLTVASEEQRKLYEESRILDFFQEAEEAEQSIGQIDEPDLKRRRGRPIGSKNRLKD